MLHGQVPGAIARFHLQPTGRLANTNRLNLAIGLPLRNQEALTNLLRQIYDPASPNYIINRLYGLLCFGADFGKKGA